jgi:Spy/CpxP family protein refolding chaperone
MMLKWSMLLLAGTLALFGQGPGGIPGAGRPGIGRDWWDNPLTGNLNLTDAQRKQLQATTREYRNRLVDARAAAEKADGDLQDLFNDAPGDDRRANDLIDRVVKTRGELLKLVTQMSWKLRGVLNAEQWQELQRRRPGFGTGFGGPGSGGLGRSGRRGTPPNGPPQGNPPNAQPPKPQAQ